MKKGTIEVLDQNICAKHHFSIFVHGFNIFLVLEVHNFWFFYWTAFSFNSEVYWARLENKVYERLFFLKEKAFGHKVISSSILEVKLVTIGKSTLDDQPTCCQTICFLLKSISVLLACSQQCFIVHFCGTKFANFTQKLCKFASIA